MAALSTAARAFLDEYASEKTSCTLAADEASTFVREILAPLSLPIHVILARAKTVSSLRGKLRRKPYPNPKTAVTDLIGLRVITYFAGHIDRVAQQLRIHLEISERKCRDARKELDEDQFGYRSVHLIARLKPGQAKGVAVSHLQRRWFEIQIRSILDHAWSEIEHEVVYKAGIDFPSDVRRRFRAVAGSLEVLEHAFAGLAVERDILVDAYKARYTANEPAMERARFDVARLMAFLEVERPKGSGWRKTTPDGQQLPSALAVAAVGSLESAGLGNSSRLKAVFRTPRFRRMVTAFAALEGIEPEQTAHVALVVMAIAVERPAILQHQFPEMLFSQSIATVTGGRRVR
jgi:ppGpp synthetase/RelA/SpoT-type nucleotidyltranferase